MSFWTFQIHVDLKYISYSSKLKCKRLSSLQTQESPEHPESSIKNLQQSPPSNSQFPPTLISPSQIPLPIFFESTQVGKSTQRRKTVKTYSLFYNQPTSIFTIFSYCILMIWALVGKKIFTQILNGFVIFTYLTKDCVFCWYTTEKQTFSIIEPWKSQFEGATFSQERVSYCT